MVEAAAIPPWITAQLPRGYRSTMHPAGSERMHVLEWGPAPGMEGPRSTPGPGPAPAILLLHGNPTWGFLWRKVVEAIRARPGGTELRLIVPDLIGLGFSSKPELDAHTLVHHATWLGEVLDRIAPGPIVVAAQDWGGPISLLAMSSRQQRLRGIVLGNTAVSPPGPTFKPTLFHKLSQLPFASTVLFRWLGFPLGLLHTSQGDRSTIRGEVARAYRWPLRKHADRAAPLALARMVPDRISGHPSVPQLQIVNDLFASTQVPISLVWGMRDPILGRVINHLERMRPDAKIVRTSAGHFLQEEVPEPLADAILEVAGLS